MTTALHVLLIAALTAGCTYWLALTVFAVLTLRAVPALATLRSPAPARWPSLSVIVPACDEAQALEAATRSRLASDYPDLELLLIDDRSRDATPAIVDALGAADPRVRALHVRELPDGWLGKVHAMHVGAQAARGEWLLFTDADVHVAPGALRRAIAHCEQRGIDHLVALPQIWSSGVLLDAVIACFGRLFTVGTQVWAVHDPESSAAVGVGAFNLVRRSALQAIGGLAPLRLAVADDLMLGLFLKRSGARQGAVNGRGQVMLHWYRSVPQMLVGLEKGLFAHAGRCSAWRLFVAGTLLLLLDAAPLVALLLPLLADPAGDAGASTWPAWLGWLGGSSTSAWPMWLAWLGGAALLSGAVAGGVVARWMGSRLLPLLLMPVGSLLTFVMFVRAGIVGWRRGGVRWRGTFYSSAQLRAALRDMDAELRRTRPTGRNPAT